ncbi:imidazole glycerol phosphate synthase subunit HisH [Herbaspirillum sp. NPDC087042]|uniref:imidazole glycerol phosphate synthase subunit HisH n=1 Tax=Herbaspirillum sp. NPDC087042 TaxID=3364004 RepID=UPI0037F4797B
MSHDITVIDVGIGNLASVLKALKKAGGVPKLTSNAADILSASKLIFPGVGAFGAGSAALQSHGLTDPIREAVLHKKIPILGFCMGMQLFADRGFENGDFPGLGLLPAQVSQLDISKCKVLPHMGWNNLESLDGMKLFQGLPLSPHFYFVHSFHMTGLPAEVQVSHCLYGDEKVTAAVQWENVYGTQFHPEKSLANGIHVLKKFIQDA